MSIFTVLSSKIFGGLAIGLALLAGYFYWRLGNANATIETQRTAIAAQDAAIRVQNAGIERQRVEGERTRQAFNAAVANGNAAILVAQGRVTIVRRTVANGCPTPPAIREAGL